MTDGFRHPTSEDYEPEASGRLADFAGRLKDRTAGMLGTLGSLLFFGMILVLWAADFRSCVRTTTSVNNGPTPRAPRGDDSAESRLTERLGALWTSMGGTPESIDIWMLDDDSINAASLGDGIFILWTGLGALTNEHLDAVVAHEIAHDKLQHSRKGAELRDVTDFIGEAIGVLGGRDEATTQTLKRWSGSFVVPRYDRAQELDADRMAVEILRTRGYSDAAAVVCGAFARLRAIAGESGGGFFDSHPALSDRIHTLRQHFPSAAIEATCR